VSDISDVRQLDANTRNIQDAEGLLDVREHSHAQQSLDGKTLRGLFGGYFVQHRLKGVSVKQLLQACCFTQARVAGEDKRNYGLANTATTGRPMFYRVEGVESLLEEQTNTSNHASAAAVTQDEAHLDDASEQKRVESSAESSATRKKTRGPPLLELLKQTRRAMGIGNSTEHNAGVDNYSRNPQIERVREAVVAGDAGLSELIRAFSGARFEPEPPPKKKVIKAERDTWFDARPSYGVSPHSGTVAITRAQMANRGALYIEKVDIPMERIWPHPSIRLLGTPQVTSSSESTNL
jgi:hypothetical protein